MPARFFLAAGSVSALVAVALGAFGAHALNDRLEEAGRLATWETGVRYQMWHALALVLFGVLRSRRPASAFPGWAFLTGSLLFSGSLYGLSLGFMRSVLGPVTPIGGGLLLLGWLGLAVQSLRASD